MNRLSHPSLVFAAVLTFGLFQNIDADIIVQTENFNGFPNYSAVLNFDQFDTSQGTLNSILVEFEIVSQNGEIRLDNDSANVLAGTVTFGSSGLISSDDVSLLDSSAQPVVDSLMGNSVGNPTLQADDGDVEVGGTIFFSEVGPDSFTLAPGVVVLSDSGFIGNAFFGQFEGLGTYDINAQLSQMFTLDFGGAGGIQFQGDPIFTNGFVRITYDYTVIPEPASATCIAGIAWFALFCKRRRKTK